MGILFWLVVAAGTLFTLSKFRPSLPIATGAVGVVLFVAYLLGCLLYTSPSPRD